MLLHELTRPSVAASALAQQAYKCTKLCAQELGHDLLGASLPNAPPLMTGGAAAHQGRIDLLEAQLAAAIRERDLARANEEVMRLKYSQLDIFKLDMIARELKKIDGEIGLLRDATRGAPGEMKDTIRALQ